MIPDELLKEIEHLKSEGKYDLALRLVNRELVKNPENKEALFQVADIEYRKGEISRAEKPIDFLLNNSNDDDPMSCYIKGVLEMEKTHWVDAKQYFQKALILIENKTEYENPEIMRCYALCEYWSGNREEGVALLEKAFNANSNDAEIILNLVELCILEKDWDRAQGYIHTYKEKQEHLQFFDRNRKYYDEKISLFEKYINGQGGQEHVL